MATRNTVHKLLSVLGICLTSGIYLFYMMHGWLYEEIAGSGGGRIYAVRYLTEAGFMVLAGMLFVCAGKFENRRKFLLILSGLVCLIIYSVMDETLFNYSLQNSLSALWPVFTFCLAGKAAGKSAGKDLKRKTVWYLFYYMAIGAAIWVLKEELIWSVNYRMPLVEVIYMSVISTAALFCMETERERENRKGAPVCMLQIGLSCAMLLVLLGSQPRARYILASLTNPITSASGVPAEDNWLGDRFIWLIRGWGGRLDAGEIMDMNVLWNCPLLWLRYEKNMLLVLFMLLAEAMVCVCVVRLVKIQDGGTKNSGLVKFLAFSILLRCAVGLLAEMIFVQNTDAGLLILRNPAEVIPYILFLGLQRQAVSEGK